MIKNIFYILFLLPLFFSCQKKYNNVPFDKKEEHLRAMPDTIKILLLDSLWYKRDSLTYLYFKNIEQLVLTETDSIPKWITKFDKLKILYVSNYQKKIKTIPNDIGKLKNLEQIDLPRNSISYIPMSLFNLIKLKRLNLEENLLANLPSDIKKLKKITILSLGNNPISILPNEICSLDSLKMLPIENTNISELPNCLNNLKLLERIYITNTKLKYVHPNILEIENLKDLDAKGLKLQNYKEVKTICEKRNITFYYDE
ncbi:leucine-rich repeat domain-containing protein [Chryseobacterium sp. KCF3-3]|uniref:leucine-rich repeat domain-containing protein n=1 Tax=Chryseobacterium sp. KCF3-3 TaxID=3231511 RepID=UPI0038B40815